MSSVEVIGAGVTHTTEGATLEAVSVQEAVASPDRPADAELALRSMEVYLPTEPVNINGRLFNVAVDQDKLKTAVNELAEDYRGVDYLYPRQLVIGVSDRQSTVHIGEGLRPQITDSSEEDRTPILTTFKGGGTSVNVTLPSKLTSTKYSRAGLVELVTDEANKDLWVALSQNLKAKRKYHLGLSISSMVLAMGAGEGAGIALANTWHEMIGYGLGGAAVSGVVAASANIWRAKLVWGSIKNFSTWSVKQSSDYKKIHWELAALAKKGSVISLNPVQAKKR